MKYSIFIIFILLTISMNCKDSIKTPKTPDEPTVIKVQEEDKSDSRDNKETANYNIDFQNQKGKFGKGQINQLKGFYLKLVWEGNDAGSEEILIDFVKSIRVKGYSPVKKTKDNLSVVYYFPGIYDIVLKDGKTIKNAKGRIKELDSFTVFDNVGKGKYYTYFVRYWLEDKKMFNDTRSKNFNETPKVPDSVVIYVEFKDNKK